MSKKCSIVRVSLNEFELEFAEDIVALVASYSARLYGRRGGRARGESK